MLRTTDNMNDLIRKVYGVKDPVTPRYTLRVQNMDVFREKLIELVSEKNKTENLDIEKQAHAMRMRDTNLIRWMDDLTVSQPAKYNLTKICYFYGIDTPEKMKDAGIELVRTHTIHLSDEDIKALSDIRDGLQLRDPAARALTRVIGKLVD